MSKNTVDVIGRPIDGALYLVAWVFVVLGMTSRDPWLFAWGAFWLLLDGVSDR